MPINLLVIYCLLGHVNKNSLFWAEGMGRESQRKAGWKRRIWGDYFQRELQLSRRTGDTLSKFCVSQTSLGQDLSDEIYDP